MTHDSKRPSSPVSDSHGLNIHRPQKMKNTFPCLCVLVIVSGPVCGKDDLPSFIPLQFQLIMLFSSIMMEESDQHGFIPHLSPVGAFISSTSVLIIVINYCINLIKGCQRILLLPDTAPGFFELEISKK